MSAGKSPNEGHLLLLPEKFFCEWLQAGAQDVNFLYSLAWIDLTGGPLVITAPDTGGRFYELQFVDVYNETPLLIGAYTLGRALLSRIWGPQILR